MLFINVMWILVYFSYIHNIRDVLAKNTRVLYLKTSGCSYGKHPDVLIFRSLSSFHIKVTVCMYTSVLLVVGNIV